MAKTVGSKMLRVVLLSGFLGSGKTTLVKRILTSTAESNANLRIAVIVNEITAENLDYVNLQGSKLVNVGNDSVVEMSNGCICCSLRLDLMRQLYELWKTQRYDAVVIESSGVSDPSEVVESFFVPVPMSDLEPEAGHPATAQRVMQSITPLVNCVTVVDASTIDDFIASDGTVGELHKSVTNEEDGDNERSISELLFMQMEFASIVVLNKVDLVGPRGCRVIGSKRSRADQPAEQDTSSACSLPSTKANSLKALATKINPAAEVHLTSQCDVPFASLLRLEATKPKDLQKFAKEMIETLSERSAGVFVADVENGQLRIAEGAVLPDHIPETEEFQISSHVFRSDRPFHPRRLYDWMTKYFVLIQLVSQPNGDFGDDDGEDGSSSEGGAVADDDKEGKNGASTAAATDEVCETCPNIPDPAPVRKERYGNLYRGKGYCWVGAPEREHLFGSWSQAGTSLSLIPGGQWEDDFPWDHPTLKQQQTTTVGAKKGKKQSVLKNPHQILSFVGQRMNWSVLEADLRALLLTDEELNAFNIQMAQDDDAEPAEPWMVDDPFAPWEADQDGDEEEEEEDNLIASG